MWKWTKNCLGKLMHSFEVNSNESACRKSERLGLEQVFHVDQCILFHLTNCVKTILIAGGSLKWFYSRLGFTVIKDFVTSTTFEAARSRIHYEKGKSKAEQKQTIGLKCLYIIPQRVRFLHDDRINFNIHKNVLIYLDGISTSETWFPNKYIEDEIKKK